MGQTPSAIRPGSEYESREASAAQPFFAPLARTLLSARGTLRRYKGPWLDREADPRDRKPCFFRARSAALVPPSLFPQRLLAGNRARLRAGFAPPDFSLLFPQS